MITFLRAAFFSWVIFACCGFLWLMVWLLERLG